VPRNKKRQSPPVSSRYLTAKECEPYVLTVMNRHFDKSLTSQQVQRLLEPVILEAGETKPTHYGYVADCLRDLVRDPETLMFSRYAVAGEMEPYHRGKPPLLYSPTDPVPAWDAALHEQILNDIPAMTGNVRESEARRVERGDDGPGPKPPEELPIPRFDPSTKPTPHTVQDPKHVIIEQPGYTVTTHRPMPMTVPDPVPSVPVPINGTPAAGGLVRRVAALTKELSELVIEVESRNRSEDLERQVAEQKRRIAELVAQNTKLQKERDSAVSQLQAVAKAQETISRVLGTR
jgi:hypothetical protein